MTVTSATYANPLTRGLEFCLGMASWVLWDRHLRGMKIEFIAWTVAELAVLTGAALWLTMLFVPAAGMFPLRLMAPLWVGPGRTLWLMLGIRDSGCHLRRRPRRGGTIAFHRAVSLVG